MKRVSKFIPIFIIITTIFISVVIHFDQFLDVLEKRHWYLVLSLLIFCIFVYFHEPSKTLILNILSLPNDILLNEKKATIPISIVTPNLLNEKIITRLASSNSYNERTYIDKDNLYNLLYREDIFPKDDKNYYSIRIISGKRPKKSNFLVYLECTENNAPHFLNGIVAYDLLSKRKIEPTILANQSKSKNGKIHYISFPLNDEEENFKIGFYVFVENEWGSISEKIMSISLTRIEKIKKLYFQVTLSEKPKAVYGSCLTSETTTEVSMKCFGNHENNYPIEDHNIIEDGIEYLKQQVPKISELYEKTNYSISMSESKPNKELYVIQWEE